ncbi:Pr6Pr family membrane protein [Halovenus sp. HT40]|uniref:Pr6Pr family membrane protein n=1 Tax=Halovenus sp. HT40 TaxID=3126691 RepID=UPI00300F64F7
MAELLSPRIEQTDRTKLLAATIALLGWFALGASLLRSLASTGGVQDLLWELLVFSGFFTFWTNTAVALAVTLPLLAPQSKPGRFFRRAGVVTGVAASIALVALVYELLLRSGWGSLGIDLLLNLLLHYLIPIAFVGYWWLVTPKRHLSWRGPVKWLSYPAGYAAFVLVRGELANTYPYPFLDVATYGYPTVLVFVAGIGAFFLLLAFLFVGLGRFAER